MGFLYQWQIWLLDLPWIDIGIAVLIAAVIFLLRKIFTKYIFKIIVFFANKASPLLQNLLLSFEKPIHFFIGIVGVYVALLYLPIPSEHFKVIHQLFRSVIIAVIGWGFFNFASTSSYLYNRIATKMEDGKDSMLIPFLSRILRFVIVALTLTIIAFEFGYDVNGFIAGLGLGGLAFALAAQDTISNFFGGVIIVTERPFKKGDWIETPTVEGIVEDISFRSTKIRAFTDSVIVVPNSTIAHEPITNWSLMTKRRITFSLEIDKSTPREKVIQVVQRIEEMLRNDEEIHQDLIIVNFNELKDYSYEIYLYFFSKTTAWVEWTKVKQKMNVEILRILEENDVELAYPTQSLYVKNSEEDFLDALITKKMEEMQPSKDSEK